MVKTEFMELYEELNQLNEKWYNIDDYASRMWFSDSAIEFKNFMKNIDSSGLKGVRLTVAPGFYLVGMAEDFNHEAMLDIAEHELALEVPPTSRIEQATCGIPKCTDFELGNYEVEERRQFALDFPDDEDADECLNYDAEREYQNRLIADYGTFELALYWFKSREFPDHLAERQYATYFEDSEIYKVLKPMLKRIYIYGR
jgi:hypothetical protein